MTPGIYIGVGVDRLVNKTTRHQMLVFSQPAIQIHYSFSYLNSCSAIKIYSFVSLVPGSFFLWPPGATCSVVETVFVWVGSMQSTILHDANLCPLFQ